MFSRRFASGSAVDGDSLGTVAEVAADRVVGKAARLTGRTGKEIKPGELGAKAAGKSYDRKFN